MPEIREYLYEDSQSPFAIWFDVLEPRAAAKVAAAYAKLERGEVGKLKPVGEGVLEFKIRATKPRRMEISRTPNGCGPSTSAGKPTRL